MRDALLLLFFLLALWTGVILVFLGGELKW
jgi:hypothetical protein